MSATSRQPPNPSGAGAAAAAAAAHAAAAAAAAISALGLGFSGWGLLRQTITCVTRGCAFHAILVSLGSRA